MAQEFPYIPMTDYELQPTTNEAEGAGRNFFPVNFRIDNSKEAK